jgi:hypothetical protein
VIKNLGISITNHNPKTDEVSEPDSDTDEVIGEIREKPFTQGLMQHHWKTIAATYAEENIQIEQTMVNHVPMLEQDGITLKLVLHNNIQQKRFVEFQSEIMGNLRDRLSNDRVHLEVVVDETIENRTYFTDTEKVQLMAEKNPKFDLLFKAFDLDLE